MLPRDLSYDIVVKNVTDFALVSRVCLKQREEFWINSVGSGNLKTLSHRLCCVDINGN